MSLVVNLRAIRYTWGFRRSRLRLDEGLLRARSCQRSAGPIYDIVLNVED